MTLLNLKNETICTVVVTYNRKQLLIECLESLLKQTHPVNAIYLIDNASTDGTPELLQEKGFIPEIPYTSEEPKEVVCSVKMLSEGNKNKEVIVYYVRMHYNSGGAGGFYEGVKRGYKKGYDWLWLMDEDAEPRSDCLFELYASTLIFPGGLVCVAPIKVDQEGEIQLLHQGFIIKDKFQVIPLTEKQYELIGSLFEIDYSSFVGPLISTKAISNVGFPDKDFFIWNDDIEYFCRLNEYGKIFLVKSSKITHKDKPEKSYNNLNTDKKSDLWKRYYGKRNGLLLYKRYRLNKFKVWGEFLYFFLRDLKDIILKYNFKLERIYLLIISYCHGVFGVKGKKINPRIWHK